jgi:Core-2/I-Branching enzyme
MRVAHLILAHKHPKQVERLIRLMEHPQFYFFIHTDAKANLDDFIYLQELPRTSFIKNRTKIYWAGYGTIQATLNGFDEIIPLEFDYINVISGQDLPLKKPEFIYNYLMEHKGTQFMTCESIETQWTDAQYRVKGYHFINWRIPGKFRLSKLATKLLPPRKFPLDFEIVGKANWFTVTNDAAIYMVSFLQKNPAVVRYFKYCWGADEFIFASILYNSHYKPSIKDNLVYVDWQGQTEGHPRILTIRDKEALQQTEKLFARKFDIATDGKIISEVERFVTADANFV